MRGCGSLLILGVCLAWFGCANPARNMQYTDGVARGQTTETIPAKDVADPFLVEYPDEECASENRVQE